MWVAYRHRCRRTHSRSPTECPRIPSAAASAEIVGFLALILLNGAAREERSTYERRGTFSPEDKKCGDASRPHPAVRNPQP